MKHRKLTAWVLMIAITAGIALVAPQASARMTKAPKPIVIPPIVKAAPIAPVIPGVIDVPVPAPDPAPAPAPEPEPETGGLSLWVDKTEAVVGDVLNFSASMTGGRGKKSIALWVFKDGERVEVLFSNAKKRWAYEVKEPGVYHGMAIGTDEGRTLYKSSRKVAVSAPATQLMSLEQLFWFTPVESFTWLEGTRFSDIPVMLNMSDKVEGYANLFTDVTGLPPWVEWWPYSGRARAGTESGQVGTIRCAAPKLQRPSCKAYSEIKGEFVTIPETNEVFFWAEGQYEKIYTIRLEANALLNQSKAQTTSVFTIRHLRDANRNGIADLYELDANQVMRLSEVSDRTVLDSEMLKKIPFRVLDHPDILWPVFYGLPEAPNQLKLIASNSGSKPGEDAFIAGTPKVKWAGSETQRTVQVRYEGENDDGQRALSAFNLRVLRDDDKDGIADGILSIEKIPWRYVTEGSAIKPIPITVRSSLPEPVTLKVTSSFIVVDGSTIIFYNPEPEEFGLTLEDAHGPVFGAESETKLYHYLLKGQFRLHEAEPWGKDDKMERRREIVFTAVANSGAAETSESFRIVLLKDSSNEIDKRVPYQFDPIADVQVDEGVDMNHINIRQNMTEEGLKIRSAPLPPGVYLNAEEGYIYGNPYIEDWQPWERERRYSINLYAVYKGQEGIKYGYMADEMIAHEQFYMTVMRRQLLPEPGLIPMPDQSVINGQGIIPVLVKCDTDQYRLSRVEISGQPEGISVGPGYVLDGTPNISDWKEDEYARLFSVKVKGRVLEHEYSPGSGVNVIVLPEGRDAETSFGLLVFRESVGEMSTVMRQKALGDQSEAYEEAMQISSAIEKVRGELQPPTEETTQSDEAAAVADKKTEASEEGTSPAPEESEAMALEEGMPQNEYAQLLKELLPAPVKPAVMAESKSIAIAQFDAGSGADGLTNAVLSGLKASGYEPGKNLQTVFESAQGDPEKAKEIAERIGKGDFALVIAIGEEMATALQKTLNGRIPLVYAGVDDPAAAGLCDEKGLGIGPVAGIKSRGELSGLLDAALLMQPHARSIGLLLAEHQPGLDEVLERAEAEGLSLMMAYATDPGQLVSEAERLLNHCDLLLLGQDAGDEETSQKLAEMSISARKPLYTLSRTQLAQGAAAAALSNENMLGHDAGHLAALVLSGVDAAAIPLQTPRMIETLYNDGMMQELGIVPALGSMPAFN